MATEQAIEFVPLLDFENTYVILNQYPFTIRNKNTGKIINERFDKDGYVLLDLNSYLCKKHRLIALQFIPNPNNLPCVDHINHNRADNRIENLRWCSQKTNCINKASHKGVVYQFVDEIPDDALIVDFDETKTNIVVSVCMAVSKDDGIIYLREITKLKKI